MKLLTLTITENSVQAHILRSRLESEGIACYIFDENMVTMNALMSNAVKGIKLKVNDFDLEEAKKILLEIEDTPITTDDDVAIQCPNCGSTHLHSGFVSSKNAKGITSLILSLIFMIFPFYQNKVYRCKSCEHEFKINH